MLLSSYGGRPLTGITISPKCLSACPKPTGSRQVQADQGILVVFRQRVQHPRLGARGFFGDPADPSRASVQPRLPLAPRRWRPDKRSRYQHVGTSAITASWSPRTASIRHSTASSPNFCATWPDRDSSPPECYVGSASAGLVTRSTPVETDRTGFTGMSNVMGFQPGDGLILDAVLAVRLALVVFAMVRPPPATGDRQPGSASAA